MLSNGGDHDESVSTLLVSNGGDHDESVSTRLASHGTRYAAIGGTTRAAMETVGFVVAGAAEKPNPLELVKAVQSCFE